MDLLFIDCPEALEWRLEVKVVLLQVPIILLFQQIRLIGRNETLVHFLQLSALSS